MSQAEYDAALVQFLAKKAVTRCPTACVGPTRVAVAEEDRAALSAYNAAKEEARREKIRILQQRVTV